METPKPSKDLKIRNVSLHSRGKKEVGTLYLARHHLVFSYVPDSGVLTSTSSKVDQLRNSASLDGARGSRESSDSTSQQATPSKARPKEIWVPYPMINHCVLRPSHSAASRAYENHNAESLDGSFEDGAFPPVYGTSSYNGRPSTDSQHLAPYSSPQRSASPAGSVTALPVASESVRAPAIRIQRRDFQMMAFHFHPSPSDKNSSDETAREVFYCLRSRCVFENVQDMLAFHFKAPPEELAVEEPCYDARREFARMGVGGKAAEGPGSAWRISDINKNYEYSPTYPSVLCVPRAVSDNMLKYGGVFRSKGRIPALTYLHSNGGSITRSSQPMVGISNKRNPQDERLISAIFSSHTPPQQSPTDSPAQVPSDGTDIPGLPTSQSETDLDDDFNDEEVIPRKRVYGSTRRNMIFDARPKINALVNKGSGGGYEDLSNYSGPAGTTVERTFMDIQNIHVMKKSLAKVVQSFANSDYLDMKPNEELLRNSGWLTHIAGMLDGAEMVARIVGLGGSHALVHCSDGWDRTAQVAALAQVMLDPHYRSLNGFITLIQKDFLAFGHKFNHRHGIQGSEEWFEIENERVLPSRTKANGNNESTGLNALGSKALSGAKNWFEKSRGGLFRPQNESKDSGEDDDSRPSSPPPNSMMHSPPTSSTKKDREHKTNTNEMGPIFHQFLDAVYQLQYQFPDAFEFNERFLRRLFYQAHSGQYGEFLFNNEKDRSEHESKFPSVWPHFLSRRQEFTNPEFVAKVDDPLLFPKRQGSLREIEVRWWSGLFGRKDEDMNTPRALAPPDTQPAEQKVPSLSMQPSTMSLEDGGKQIEGEGPSAGAVKEAKSFPNIGTVGSSLPSTFNSLQNGSSNEAQQPAENSNAPARPTLESRETNPDTVEGYVKAAEPASSSSSSKPPASQLEMDEGDPLGVSAGSKVPETTSGRLDFAVFAQSSAYSDR
ncbi:hypothetical protein M409DRAFT_62694 [Zasmidium cellare ATCC 36951]|uniref:Myotubularin phosphatase domain-containing protein n=1 Tax=Zasmidium cellare ATCC 36951 TaxID=1080233 RepID=A0A6A6D4F3_ZASCE|nr:uncharacterized protein M409DRAFT_62694 [Zasmidium cellare ATCC 36951]KAF2173082.1 hypothetical protein M409DRAFT_62694 [Zasmidium cellare ATCC 36951]